MNNEPKSYLHREWMGIEQHHESKKKKVSPEKMQRIIYRRAKAILTYASGMCQDNENLKGIINGMLQKAATKCNEPDGVNNSHGEADSPNNVLIDFVADSLDEAKIKILSAIESNFHRTRRPDAPAIAKPTLHELFQELKSLQH